jgi:hypothetical protein
MLQTPVCASIRMGNVADFGIVALSNRCSLTPRAVGAQTRKRGYIAFKGDAQRPIVGVQIIQHAGDLQAGGIQQFSRPL